MPYISVGNKQLFLSEEECAYIKLYKSSSDDSDIELLFGASASSFFLEHDLSSENINKFLLFLNNPSNDLLREVSFREVSKMIEMVLKLVDACTEYAMTAGPIERVLYRSEDSRNMPTYNTGEIVSMKSTTSKEEIATYTFNYDGTDKVAYKVYGFCPHILVEDCVNGGYFGNEAEYLFPPFISCKLKDEKYVSNRDYTFDKVVEISDDFSFDSTDALSVSGDEFNEIVARFKRAIITDRKSGIVSEESKALADIINKSLRCYARNKYCFAKISYKYNKFFEDAESYDVIYGSNTFNNVCLNWPKQYRGFEDAVIQYYQDRTRNWRSSDTIHVYTLSYMINSGLISEELLDELYGSSECQKLDTYFLERAYRMTIDGYFEFLSAFNVMAGYGEHGKDEIFEVKNNMSLLAIDILHNSINYDEQKEPTTL